MMPPASHVPHATFLLVLAGLVTVAVIATTMVIARRALRAQLLGGSRAAGRNALNGNGAIHASASDGCARGAASDGVVRTLAERGLVDGPQLASMSAAEREFFLATVTAKLGDGVKPRLMTQTRTAGVASSVASRVASGGVSAGAVAVPPEVIEEPVPHAALVSGAIHCPVCRTPIGKRTDAPLLMSRCPGCSRRVAAHIDGDRLTVTLHYTLRTPAMGVVTIKP
jgi:hypothetical protein